MSARIMRVFRVFRFFRQLANWAMMILDSLKSLFGALILLGLWAGNGNVCYMGICMCVYIIYIYIYIIYNYIYIYMAYEFGEFANVLGLDWVAHGPLLSGQIHGSE